MKGFGKQNKDKSGAEGGTAPAAPASGDDAAAELQRQIDGAGGQVPPPPAETVSPPAAADAPAKSETTEPTPPDAPVAAPPVLKWFVRAGRSITSPSGVIGENQEVKPTDIALPDEAAQLKQLAYLVEKNILYRAYEAGNEVLPPPKNPVDLRAESKSKKKK